MYNKEEIEKNLRLFESSLNEVFAKIAMEPCNSILYMRAETTLQLADCVKTVLKEYDDSYAKRVVDQIDSYQSRFDEIRNNSNRPYAIT